MIGDLLHRGLVGKWLVIEQIFKTGILLSAGDAIFVSYRVTVNTFGTENKVLSAYCGY